jgi:hypothetical protein
MFKFIEVNFYFIKNDKIWVITGEVILGPY